MRFLTGLLPVIAAGALVAGAAAPAAAHDAHPVHWKPRGYAGGYWVDPPPRFVPAPPPRYYYPPPRYYAPPPPVYYAPPPRPRYYAPPPSMGFYFRF